MLHLNEPVNEHLQFDILIISWFNNEMYSNAILTIQALNTELLIRKQQDK